MGLVVGRRGAGRVITWPLCGRLPWGGLLNLLTLMPLGVPKPASCPEGLELRPRTPGSPVGLGRAVDSLVFLGPF